MPTETEIKIRLTSQEQVDTIRRRCSQLFGKATEVTQRDEYFDTSNQLLQKKDFTVRLRTVDGTAKIALKGPRGFFENKIHKRIELEFSVLTEDEARREIAGQDLIATAILEKHRCKFVGDGLKVAIDTLPFIGSFLEIEASTTEKIEEAISELQISIADAVSENYSELLEQHLMSIELPLRPNLNATFEAEAEWRRKS